MLHTQGFVSFIAHKVSYIHTHTGIHVLCICRIFQVLLFANKHKCNVLITPLMIDSFLLYTCISQHDISHTYTSSGAIST